MNSQDFCYWLKGFSEIAGKVPTKEQWQVIQDHLSLVFNKVTPLYKNPTYCENTSPTFTRWDFILSGNPPVESEYDFKKINITC